MFSLRKKANGFFVELNEQSALMARTSGAASPMVIETIKEVALSDEPGLRKAVLDLMGKNSSGYLHARCGVYPSTRFIRRVTLDLKRIKDPGYFGEICSQQLRVEPEKSVIAVLNSQDGTDYEIGRATTLKEVVFAGGQGDDLLAIQERLLGLGVYPERLELGSLALLGGLVNYHAVSQIKTPTLVLEIEGDGTQSFIVTAGGLDVTRSIPQGLEGMIPIVQKELNLKDEESARKLFFSNTFDFTNMGGLLIKKLLKELQSLIGFYEVQTGQSIGQVLCTRLPAKLAWLSQAIAKELGVGVLQVDVVGWLKSHDVTIATSAAGTGLDVRWLGLFGLMLNHDVVAAEKK